MHKSRRPGFLASQFLFAMALSLAAYPVHAQGAPPGPGRAPVQEVTTDELNRQLEQSRKTPADSSAVFSQEEESRIGPGDLLEITCVRSSGNESHPCAFPRTGKFPCNCWDR